MAAILVVDDERLIRECLEATLHREGFQISTACNGAEGIVSLTRQKPDLIILDIKMPVMDGLSMLRAIRGTAATKTIPVIILTDSAEKRLVVESAKLGIQGYILKSRFSLREMVDSIRKNLSVNTDSDAKVAPAAADTSSRPTAALQPVQQLTPENSGDLLRSLKPIISRSEIAELIDQCEELKGFSPAVAEVLRLTANHNCSIEQVAKAISRDHAMALKILKLANSAVYTRGDAVDSVLKAVLRIGLGQIRQTVLNIAVVERYSGGGVEGFVESGQFWEHAIATGIIAAEIAHSRSEKEADGAFTMGLLHDVGRMVFIAQLGDTYRKVLQAAHDLQLPLEEVEHRMLCFNHADGMDRVFRAWKFSKELINPIVFHHLLAGNIREAAPQEVTHVATLGLANRLAHAFMLGSSGNQTIYATEDLCELLRLDSSVIERIEQIVRDETDKVKFALLANSSQANWPQLREVHRQSLSIPLRPLYVSSSPAIDAHRILCDQLAQWDEGSVPNIGVISFRQMRERATLTAQYKAKESELGLFKLPLLVISPGGKITPDLSLLGGRAVESISTPFTVGRAIAAMNRLLGTAVAELEITRSGSI